MSIWDFGDHGPPLIAILCLLSHSSVIDSHLVSDVNEPGLPWSSSPPAISIGIHIFSPKNIAKIFALKLSFFFLLSFWWALVKHSSLLNCILGFLDFQILLVQILFRHCGVFLCIQAISLPFHLFQRGDFHPFLWCIHYLFLHYVSYLLKVLYGFQSICEQNKKKTFGALQMV